ncbi:MAG: acetyl/propionyl/methylcrotonyl-CoA carboxylase subunit alpha [Alphaproteobacteria bacterium]|nr:acetyl/propionyl/methylcrotonyl-CoA carboxylase subunit alpha [Alphaproteobacteria bacterium]
MTLATLLIANRGEIACRIARTARDQGIRTVAVYSEADAAAPHVTACDEAHLIGPAPAAESYLVQERILAVAKESGADAIHPGYGFLSENAGFAQAVEDAGLIFVGPPASAISAMGDKAAAKRAMETAGVPLVPGYHAEAQDPDLLRTEADRIGYPVLLKAAAGGGGKGMKPVFTGAEFPEALDSAKREAKAAFGDETMIIEKYLVRPRHIEIQVFADGQGNAVHLFERDCSVQRRHQKVIEEAPAPGMTPEWRAEMGAAAVAAAKAIGYRGAGTVEFIVDEDNSFYFMEMNTRLQVEHPVTEAITGLDLVALQLAVARGEALPFVQEDLTIDGHAFEARLYAEDPEKGFLPQTGTLSVLRLPEGIARVDAGVVEGGAVSVHYDPMIAKIVTHGPDRATALSRLERALAETAVLGVATNVRFLKRLAAHPDFRAGDVHTRFIEQHETALLPRDSGAPGRVIAYAALALLMESEERARQAAKHSGDRTSPWAISDGFRLNRVSKRDLILVDGETERAVTATFHPGLYHLHIGGEVMAATVARAPSTRGDGRLAITLDGQSLTVAVHRSGTGLLVGDPRTGLSYPLSWRDPMAATGSDTAAEGSLTAPMPGKIIRVLVSSGQQVVGGEALLVVEAMKMEHTIRAPEDGVVVMVHYQEGDLVEEGTVLVDFEAEKEDA